MINRTYTSNLSPRWPFDKQEALLRTLDGWPKGYAALRDDLDVRARRAHKAASLVGRASLLRPSRRSDGETIYVASLAVLAWSVGDLLAVLTAAGMRGAAVVALDVGLTIPPSDASAVLHQAMQAFELSRKADAALKAGEAGSKVSVERRTDAARAKCETIRREWRAHPSEPPTSDLLAKAGVSRNTVKKYVGDRPAKPISKKEAKGE
jgi:hypothetical protein